MQAKQFFMVLFSFAPVASFVSVCPVQSAVMFPDETGFYGCYTFTSRLFS